MPRLSAAASGASGAAATSSSAASPSRELIAKTFNRGDEADEDEDKRAKGAKSKRSKTGLKCKMAPVTPLKELPSPTPSNEADNLTKRLHFAVWPCGNFDQFMELLNLKPDEIHGRFGVKQETLLHRACRYGNKKAFNQLVSMGAVLTAKNNKGATPMHIAAQFRQLDMVKELLVRGAPVKDTDDQGDQALHYAAKAGCLDTINVLIEHGAVKCTPGFRGNTIMHYAAQSGKLELLQHLVSLGCVINKPNALSERPLHMAAACFTMAHNRGVDVIRLLLDAGAELNARTAWGDTAVHYAGRFGTADVLEFLLAKGIDVDKPQGVDLTDFYDKYEVTERERDDFAMSLLQKVAKSTCIYKAQVVLDALMDARNKIAHNMYASSRGFDEDMEEISSQQKAFLMMSTELSETDRHEEDDDDAPRTKSKCSAIQMFLKYAPDALNRLFDRCLIKPCHLQVQGKIYFDFFLFYPFEADKRLKTSGGEGHPCSCSSELALFTTLIASGKERFLIHPIFETFLKLKWYKTWKFYALYVLLYLLFVVSLSGFALAHYGKLYKEQAHIDHGTRSPWWWALCVTSSYVLLLATAKAGQMLKSIFKSLAKLKDADKRRCNILERAGMMTCILVKDMAIPSLCLLVLFSSFEEHIVRYFLACTVILASYHFMNIISRLPKIGIYVHMLSKVMTTVLNFFASYFWHFLGYAIAFHILLRSGNDAQFHHGHGNATELSSEDRELMGPFEYFPDSFIKVLTMLMGEYEFNLNFVSSPQSSPMAKLLFVVFLFDMSVVLMNLVLGLAVSDIEELQRNSAVRRMIQETCTVVFMENLFMALARVPIPGFARFFSPRITSEMTATFSDVLYLDLVDLDKNPSNCIVHERTFPVDSNTFYSCPHYLVTNIAAIVRKIFLKNINKDDPKVMREMNEFAAVKKQQLDILERLNKLSEKLGVDAANDKSRKQEEKKE